MSKIFAGSLASFLFAFTAAVAFPAQAADQVGPLDLTGELQGAPYKIRVPATWNGTLLVHLHGYRDKADHPGEVDDRSVDAAPGGALLESVLLAQGYALAGTAYRSNGWAVDEGVKDVRNLTNFFGSAVAKPDRTILWGFSMGSVITLQSMEKFGGIYDGAIGACAVGAGTSRAYDTTLVLNLAYDIVFGLPPALGTPGDVRDDVDFESEFVPTLFAQVSDPANFPKFEFIRLIGGIGSLPLPVALAVYPGWVFTDLYFATEARAELERRAGGAFTQNLNHVYTLSAADRAYLNALGLPNVLLDQWLGAMNVRTNTSGEPSARNYVEHNADFNGKIKNPVLTLHTVVDTLVPVSHEAAYRDTVTAAGNTASLYQVYTNGVGHCNFTGPQLVTAVAAIDAWVRTGTPPTAAQFPAALGFVPGFVPPPFAFPAAPRGRERGD